MKPLVLTVDLYSEGMRLDAFASDYGEISRSMAVKLIESGDITVNGKAVPKNTKLSQGDEVTVVMPKLKKADSIGENIPLDIVYEDSDIIVINKRSGMVVHPAPGAEDGTLVNALIYHCGDSLSGIGGVERPGIVHRIDKDTSGLLVVAKNDQAHTFLSEKIKKHEVVRVYRAVCVGKLKDDSGVIDKPIGRNPSDRKKMAVITDDRFKSRDAVTNYRVLERYDLAYGMGSFCLVECILETGRTHQIRVHMASTGHPILGDPVYGGDKTKFFGRYKDMMDGQLLHAGELILEHPRTHEKMHFTAPMPDNMQDIIDVLNKGNINE